MLFVCKGCCVTTFPNTSHLPDNFLLYLFFAMAVKVFSLCPILACLDPEILIWAWVGYSWGWS